MLFKKNNTYVEIFFMADYYALLKIEKDLKTRKIQYRLKTKNNTFRLSLNNLDGHCLSLNRDKYTKYYYKILVKREDTEVIKEILSQY